MADSTTITAAITLTKQALSYVPNNYGLKDMPNSFILKEPSSRLPTQPAFGDAMAFSAGLIMPFSFEPFGLYGLSIAALALLFHTLIEATPRRAFWRGWIFGVAMFGVGVFWIHESFKFAAVALPLALLLTGILVTILAFYPALFGLLVTLRSPRRPKPIFSSLPLFSLPSIAPLAGFSLLVLPAGWVLQEWIRGWFLSGFPWLQLGYAHVDSPLAGFGPLLGVYGVGWSAAISAGLAWLIFYLLAGHNKFGIRKRVIGFLALLVLGCGFWIGGTALRHISWTTPIGTPIQVALVQGNVSQDIKWQPSQRQPTLDRYLSLTRQENKRDLVIWPETALPGFYRDFADFTHHLRQEARDSDTHILLGTVVIDEDTRQYFNSVVAVTDNEDAFYHKRHLVPFGEYLPLAEILQGILDFLMIPMPNLSPGPSIQPPLNAAGQVIGASVCYESSFGRDILLSLPKATLLVNISNDAWFGDSLGPHQNLQMARMRAQESGRYLLRGTNTGISALIDPKGRIIGHALQFQTSVVTGTVTGMVGTTPYVEYGDTLIILLALAILIIGLYIVHKKAFHQSLYS